MTPPRHIGQYRIVRKIGAGGMGVVFLGEHRLLGRRAAIKTLLPTVAVNREIVERFFNEARATAAIGDPGVIQIFDFGYHVDGTAYIVMELLEGEALSARVERLGRLALGDALRFARQIAGSLAAAHARDIVHRDLKPENIFLVHDAEAQGGERTKIIDFGVCKVGAGDPGLTEVGAMIGTPVYMSPEQCRGTGEVDPRSDIYAFGCLMFHLLTGRPPFLGEASSDLIAAHLRSEAPPASQYVPELPPAVDALLERCLAKAPEDRFASVAELLVALGELAEQAESAGPPAAGPPPAVPLGGGFRSMYDANMAAALRASLAGSAIGPGGPERLQFASPPPPRLPPTDEELEPPPRSAVRVVLACVVVVGVTLGLVVTPLVLGDDTRHRPASAPPPAALPVERSAAGPADPALGRPATAEHPVRPTGVAGSAASAPKRTEPPHRAGPARGAREASHAGASSSPSRDPSRIDLSRSAAKQGSGSPCGEGSPCGDPAKVGSSAPAAQASRPVTSPEEVPASSHRASEASETSAQAAPETPPAEVPAAAPEAAPAPAEASPATPGSASTPPAAPPPPSGAPFMPPTAPSSATEDLDDSR